MKPIYSLFGLIFGLTSYSCFWNLFTGRRPSSAAALFFVGVLTLILAALCLRGLINSVKKNEKTGANIIVKTKIVDNFGKVSTASAVSRGVAGGIVAGPIGAMIGSSTAKEKRTTTFLIFYKDGKKVTRTVPNNSFEYQKYIKYLEN